MTDHDLKDIEMVTTWSATWVFVPWPWWKRWSWRVWTLWRPSCRVYWGSHGCRKRRWHVGSHECDCCECDDHVRDHDDEGCVAKPPYYGPDTAFYGEDAA